MTKTKIKATLNDYSIINSLIKQQDHLDAFESGNLAFLKDFKDAVEAKMKKEVEDGTQYKEDDEFIDVHIPESVVEYIISKIDSSPLISLRKKINGSDKGK